VAAFAASPLPFRLFTEAVGPANRFITESITNMMGEIFAFGRGRDEFMELFRWNIEVPIYLAAVKF